MVTLSASNGHTFCSQDVADLALGDGYPALPLETLRQLFLGERRIALFLLPEPLSTLSGHFIRVTVTMVDQRLPIGTALAVSTAEIGQ